ncbi:hypothetical protein JCM8547_005557 [Rhodosporidiobolus lusitaniae]
MTQLPSSPASYSAPYGQPGVPYSQYNAHDSSRRASVPSGVGAGSPFPLGAGGVPQPAWTQSSGGTAGAYPAGFGVPGNVMEQPMQAETPYAAPFAPPSGAAFSPQQPSSPFPSAVPYSPQPHAPPHHSHSRPLQPTPPAQSHPSAFSPHSIGDPAAVALAAHHRSLVGYFWLYAQQGLTAPLTAEVGSEERERQEKARKEAVDWARQCGIAVQPAPDEQFSPAPAHPEQARKRAAIRPLPAAPVSAPPPAARERERTTSRPLPVAPSGSRAPAPLPPITTARAPPTPVGFGRAASLTSPNSPVSSGSGAGLSRSASDAVSRSTPSPSPSPAPPGSSGGKRPLPVPPIARSSASSSSAATTGLESSLASVAISAPQPPPPRSTSPAPPAVPTFSFGDDESSSPAPPAVPTFSFGDDEDEPSSANPPAVPSFSFGGPDDDEPVAAPAASTSSSSKPPIHPRHDPTHPSHHLYHPTSVSTSRPSPSPSTLPSTAEAGTVLCTSCGAPIFGRVLLALNATWHPSCFVCAEEGCGARLEVMEFEGTPEDWDEGEEGEEGEEEEEEEEVDSSEDEEGWVKTPRRVRRQREQGLRGKAWCMVHFEERFALYCHHCNTPISSADYLPISNPSLPAKSPSSTSSSSSLSPSSPSRTPKTRYYHPLHFFCAGCGDTFLDPVAYERSLAPNSTITLEVKPYFAREGHPYCGECDLRMWRVKCPGCRKGLREEDGFLEVPVGSKGGAGGEEGEGDQETQKWHEGCFKCSRCTRPLPSIYLLRLETTLVPRTRKQGGGFEEVQEERPYCAECYDVKAKEEAEAAVDAAGK